MPYFSYFPSISYTMDKNDLTKVQVVKDVTVRAKISDYFKNAAITSLPYEIQDGERPETLSHRIYDRADLHWLILLFNEIHDPTFEWPLSSAELESYISEKHRGYTVYYPDTARIPDTSQLQNTLLLSGAKTIHQDLSNGTTVSADIIKWDPTYNSIVIDGEQASLFDPTYDYIYSQDGYARFYLDNDPTKILAFSRLQPRQFSVHHFEDSDGNTLDPRSGPPSDIANSSSILNRYVTDIGFVDVIAVDNRTQEYRLNDEKRLIRAVKPEFISAILTQFRSIFT
jgi:hypothetical protein